MITDRNSEAIDEAHESGYTAGSRAAWQSLLLQALGHLSNHDTSEQPLAVIARQALQLEQVRASLRSVCRDHGDNDWDDDLDLSDVIEKHLAAYLNEEE